MENPHGSHDEQVRKENGGPQWFEGMKSSLTFIKTKQDSGLVKTMLFSELVELFCPDIF
jgi:hypothetical protein